MPSAIELAIPLINLLSQLMPQLEADFRSGLITDAQQTALQAAVTQIEATGFTGPEWVPSTQK